MKEFDDDNSGTIDGAEFLVHFFKMGFAEREAQVKFSFVVCKRS